VRCSPRRAACGHHPRPGRVGRPILFGNGHANSRPAATCCRSRSFRPSSRPSGVAQWPNPCRGRDWVPRAAHFRQGSAPIDAGEPHPQKPTSLPGRPAHTAIVLHSFRCNPHSATVGPAPAQAARARFPFSRGCAADCCSTRLSSLRANPWALPHPAVRLATTERAAVGSAFARQPDHPFGTTFFKELLCADAPGHCRAEPKGRIPNSLERALARRLLLEG